VVIDKSSPVALYDYFTQTPEVQEELARLQERATLPKTSAPEADEDYSDLKGPEYSLQNMLKALRSNGTGSSEARADSIIKFMLNNALRGKDNEPADLSLSAPVLNEASRVYQWPTRFEVPKRVPDNDLIAYTPESAEVLDEQGRRVASVYTPSDLGAKLFENVKKADFPPPLQWREWLNDMINWTKTGKHLFPSHDVTEPYFETENGKVYAEPKPGYINNRSDLIADVEVALPKEARGQGTLPQFETKLPEVITDFEIPEDFKAEANSHPIEPTSPRYEAAMRQFTRGQMLYDQYLKTGEIPEDSRDAFIFDKYTDMLGYGRQHADKVISNHISRLEKAYVDPSKSPQQRGQIKKDLLWFYLLQDKDDVRAGIKFPAAPSPTYMYNNFVHNYLSNKIREKYLGDEKSAYSGKQYDNYLGDEESAYSGKQYDNYRNWESPIDKLGTLKQALLDAKELGTMTPEAYRKLLAEYKKSKAELKSKFTEAKETGLDKALASAGKNR